MIKYFKGLYKHTGTAAFGAICFNLLLALSTITFGIYTHIHATSKEALPFYVSGLVCFFVFTVTLQDAIHSWYIEDLLKYATALEKGVKIRDEIIHLQRNEITLLKDLRQHAERSLYGESTEQQEQRH